jgi:hypothetical protein
MIIILIKKTSKTLDVKCGTNDLLTTIRINIPICSFHLNIGVLGFWGFGVLGLGFRV